MNDADVARPGPHGTTRKSSDMGAPQISLPKGGGAISGIGEKLAINPASGTASLTIPIATSPGRNAFGPRLELTYDSGAGNGPFGMGWTLTVPAITRRTDRGLPQYRDAEDSDTFLISAAEDLVPALVQEPDGGWVRDSFALAGFQVTRYRPRIEGLFARIERWTRDSDGDTHWRSISKTNVMSFYGQTAESRIADPRDPRRIFSWLICETNDDKGNSIVYEYVPEDSSSLPQNAANERNRDDLMRSAQRYLKRIRYGNVPSRLVEPSLANLAWLFEVVLDYGEGHCEPAPGDAQGREFVSASLEPTRPWPARQDPISRYRSGFEVRTYRLCRRVLTFHHFPDELGTPDYLVRATEFDYLESSRAAFIRSVTQCGFVRQGDGRYLKRSLPPVDFEYSQAPVQRSVNEVDPASLENIPSLVDGQRYQWLDLDGEGLQGILAERAGAWYFKRNVSPLTSVAGAALPAGPASFEPLVEVTRLPGFAQDASRRHQFLDLAGDGQLDCVVLDRPVAGFFERNDAEDWDDFTPLPSLPNVDWADPNLRFIDLDGDGRADVLVSEHDVFTWHRSLGEKGFAAGERVLKARQEEEGPAVVFADGVQSIFLADMSGDGLTSIVRIRNGEVCYWPNLGYGRFGSKITLDGAPWFDSQTAFDPRRLRLADVDGTGTTDIFYLGADGVRLYFNEAGNGLSAPETLDFLPRVNDLSAIDVVDLLGNGTACLVWTSSEPGALNQTFRYVDLMGGQKPFLLVGCRNNLGAETRLHYAPSTRFYLADRRAGQPWATRLPFPVQVVERTETFDWISRNRFVSRYTYHHGYFDGVEREFRGFGRVEQRDTEELGVLSASGAFPKASNLDSASYVPPVLTKTWFHTGAWPHGARISQRFEREYYREAGVGGLSEEAARAMQLADTVLPPDVTGSEVREAIRSLKGMVLRQEVYALDETESVDRPYSIAESNYTIRKLQPSEHGRPAVFLTHAREAIDFQYERKLYDISGRKLADPRVTHEMVLEADDFGNVLRSASIAYGRRHDDPDPRLTPVDRSAQKKLRITFGESRYTNAVSELDAYRLPALAEARTYELVKVAPDSNRPDITNLLGFDELARKLDEASDGLHDLSFQDFEALDATEGHPYRRLLSHVRTVFRKNDLSGPLPLGALESLAVPFDSFQLALTPELLALYARDGQSLLSAPDVLGGEGGYILGDERNSSGEFPSPGADGLWWVGSGQTFLSPGMTDTVAQELAFAREHFFTVRRLRDVFGNTTFLVPDRYDLLPLETEDPLHNKVTVGERQGDGNITNGNDYRVLQAALLTDPNDNRSQVAFDAFGLVAGTALMGKPGESLGDSLAGFVPDPTQAQIEEFFADPRGAIAAELLQNATTRMIYDAARFMSVASTRQDPLPPASATIMRETHVSDLLPGEASKRQVHVNYSDGFGRAIQEKIQAEPGPLTPGGAIIDPRWVATGWTIVNNKGKPVRRYEPFFDDTAAFRFGVEHGVSSILFYDPAGRVVATLHPNHQWQKAVIDPWKMEEWDASDTVLVDDPRTDVDVGRYFIRLQQAAFLPGWHGARASGALGPLEQEAALKSTVHASTPATSFFDSLGRSFLAVAHNKFRHSDSPPGEAAVEAFHLSRVITDIQGNERAIIDPKDRIIIRRDYDLRGSCLRQVSMEAGTRWMLGDASGQPLRMWDSRGQRFRTEYDEMRRPLRQFVQGSDAQNPAMEVLLSQTEYGEGQANDVQRNLRTKPFRLSDSAGVAISEAYDFKGNLLRMSRRLTRNFDMIADWSANPQLETQSFSSTTRFDAVNRPIFLKAPDGSEYRSAFNEANLLERIDVNLRGAALATSLVSSVEYDARGRRARIEYGNGVSTEYSYDPEMFRLVNLKTTRAGGQEKLQDLSYVFDAAGNITHVSDDAQQTVYFSGQVVTPDNGYTYDALARLISAEGREHIGQTSRPQTTWNDEFRSRLPAPTDAQAMRRYTERYEYDAIGNVMELRHQATNGNWTRRFTHEEPSLIEPGKVSNRLSSAVVGTEGPERYSYDAHGNIVAMPHLTSMQWNASDQLHSTSRQVVSAGVAGRAYYTYGASGQRMRKVMARPDGSRRNERLYLGGFEVYREYDGSGTVVTLERETLHLMDDQERIALAETLTVDSGSSIPDPKPVLRYQFGNLLGSASLELDEAGQVISYEEYHPYGSTSYQAGRSAAEVSLKRYRYTGMERDEETGFNYHGARYYAPWLARWISADPAGLQGGMNLYAYAHCNPVKYSDRNGAEPETYAEVLPGLLSDYPHLGQLWDASADAVLENKFGKGSHEKNLKAFHKWLDGKPEGPRRTEAAREVFNSVRQSFYRKVGKQYQAGNKVLGGLSLDKTRIDEMAVSGKSPIPGSQIDHAIDELAINPYESLKASNLGIRKGHAGVKGGSHFEATEGRKARRLLGKAVTVLVLFDAGKAAARVGDRLLHGDIRGAAREVKNFAYDQTIGAVVDVASTAKDIAEFVADPLAGLRESIEEMKKEQEAQLDRLDEMLGRNDPPAPPQPAPVVTPPPPPPPKKVRNAAEGAMMLIAAIALAAYASLLPARAEESPVTTTTEADLTPSRSSQPSQPPMCQFWTPTGIPFPNIPGPCLPN